MKRYKDIDLLAQQAKPEEQLILNEATIARNMVESDKQTLKAECRTFTVPIILGDKVVRRTAVYDKNIKQSQVDVLVVKGSTYSPEFLIIDAESPTAKWLTEEREVKKKE